MAKYSPGIHIRIINIDRTAALEALDTNRIDLLIDTNEHHNSCHLKQELYLEDLVFVIKFMSDIDELTID